MSKKKRWKEWIKEIEERRKEIREESRIFDLCGKVLGKERSLENIDKVIKFLFEQGFKGEYIEAIVFDAQFFFSPSWLPPLDEKVIEEETERFARNWEEYEKEVFGKEFIGPVLDSPEKYSDEEKIKIFGTYMNIGFLLIDRGFDVIKNKLEYYRIVTALFMFIKICLRSIQKSSS